MEFNWPEKETRENIEIKGFIDAYKRLPHGKRFVVESKSDKPDYVLRDEDLGINIGVELTSVYLNNRSIPDEHIPISKAVMPIIDNTDKLRIYLGRIIEAIRIKIAKANNLYCKKLPLILSIYVNEYISIYLTENDLKGMVKDNTEVFDAMSPFTEIVLWNLPNSAVFSIRPEN
jgi:hypothetical protein